MFRSGLSRFQRTLLVIGGALVLPVLALMVLQVLQALGDERRDVEAEAMGAASQMLSLADGRVQADLSAARVLATARAIKDGDWALARQRSAEVAELNGWKSVYLTDAETGRRVFDLLGSTAAPATRDLSRPVAGVSRTGTGCPCVFLNVPAKGPQERLYQLTVVLDPTVFQAVVSRMAPREGVAALVDRRGWFIGRSRAFTERVGLPATRYVREAIRNGREGFYEGTTYEGLKNYTAFKTSDLTGWSAHVAVEATLIDRPRIWSTAMIVVAAVAALIAAGSLLLYVLYDLAAARREDERLREAQKMEAVGRLTGGIAHDFNNLLTAVIGSLDMLQKRLDDPRSKRLAENALEAARRGAKLTAQLLAFSRRQQIAVSAVDLKPLLEGMDDLLRQSLGSKVELEVRIDDDARRVMSDPHQLELALLNLAINARDALPDGGRFSITSRKGEGGMVELTATDDGVGMPPSVAQRAMEPFFTTKPQGQGTGLGLAQVFGTVRQSGGDVVIRSAPGQGTSIVLMLPAAAEAPAVEKRDPASSERRLAENGRNRPVLVVDDEPGVREFMSGVLEQAGFDVRSAENAREAMAAIAEKPPHLLVTDFAMPGESGAELVLRARAAAPEMKVLMVSGYADTREIEAVRCDGPLLRKPFDSETFLAAVRGALRSQPA